MITCFIKLRQYLSYYKFLLSLIFSYKDGSLNKILHISFGDFLNFDKLVEKSQQEYSDKNLHIDNENF